jgi:sigma-B regulation protein RsbU (phosphoserine phosphatase)
MEDMFYTEHEITLQPGDRLYLYTDGVTEAMNKEHELFGDPRLLETIDRYTSLPLKEFAQKMKSEIDKIVEGTGQADAITMLALHYKEVCHA